MLIKCPDCQLQVSDKAASCPHCGYPMKETTKISRKKRMRLPNGFGQISEIKNQRLREPYRAMITTGTSDKTGRPICKLLKPKAYFRTYNEAYQALVEYHKTPYEMAEGMTLKELYEEWIEIHGKNITAHRVEALQHSFKRCAAIENISVNNIHVRDLKSVTDVDMPFTARRRMKELLNMLFDYALENEFVTDNPARKYKVQADRPDLGDAHSLFTDEEMRVLWANQGNDIVDAILVQCYSGFRATELMTLRANINEWTFTGGSKTEAGKDRVVPIHTCIREIVKRYVKEDGSMFGWSYHKYRRIFKSSLQCYDVSQNHKTHDCRVQFVTMAKSAGMDEYALKRIVGHAIDDVTEKVYSKRGIDWLAEEIEKIKAP